MAVHGSRRSRKRQLQFFLSLLMFVTWWKWGAQSPQYCNSNHLQPSLLIRAPHRQQGAHEGLTIMHHVLLATICCCMLDSTKITARCISFPEGGYGAAPYHLFNWQAEVARMTWLLLHPFHVSALRMRGFTLGHIRGWWW